MYKKLPIIIHLPHSATFIPPEMRSEILIDDAALQEEILRVTDHYTDELFGHTEFTYIINPYSRLVYDPERFRDDAKERMSLFGLGAIYQKTSQGEILRNLSQERKEQILQELYDPHHQLLEEKVQGFLDIYGSCLIIDAHSFNSNGDYGDTKENLPSICIGTDGYHTPTTLEEFVLEFFSKKQQLFTKINYPYSGSLVPIKFYEKDKRVSTIMIEINRNIYMDETTGEKSKSFESLQKIIQKFIFSLDEWFLAREGENL